MVHVKHCVCLIVLAAVLLFFWNAEASTAQARTTSAAALPPCASSSGGVLQVASSCDLDVKELQGARQLRLRGSAGPKLPTVQVAAPAAPSGSAGGDAGAEGVKGVESVSLSNLILHSTDSFPDHAIDLASLLRPSHLAGSSGAAAVNLTNVMLLHDVPSAQAAVAIATLRGVVSDPIVQRGIAAWTLQLYTDYVSFVYVSSYSAPGLTCNGCGVFLRFLRAGAAASSSSINSSWDQPTLTPDEPRPAVNYLLAVDNSTFLPALQRYGSISSPRPLLLLLASNITWGGHPLLRAAPGGHMQLNRPVILVAQYGMLTAMDLGMVANAVHITGAYSNVTFHGVSLENLGYGDRQSGSAPAGLSVMNPFNLWILYWPREDIRFALVNTTTVASHQSSVQYLSYWQIMTSSSDPTMRAQAAWTQRGPGITVWEAIVYPKSMLDVKFVARSSTAYMTWRVSTPSVFRQLPDNVDDPSLYQTGIKVHSAAPLAALAGSNEQLQVWLTTLSGLPREGLAVIIAPALSLGPNAANNWPPPGDVELKAPRTLMIGQRVCEVPDAPATATAPTPTTSSSSGGVTSSKVVTIVGERAIAQQMPSKLLLEGLGLSSSTALATVLCSTTNASISGDSGQLTALERLAHYPMLDWSQETSLLQLQPTAGAGVLELNSLTLVGLSQGQGVGAAAADGSSSGRRLAGYAASVAAAVGVGGHAQPQHQHQQQWQRLAMVARQSRQQQQLLVPDCSGGGCPSSRCQPSSSKTKQRRQLLADSSSSSQLTQADARVWTHLVWAVHRAAGGQLSLRSVSLGLPEPEFRKLLAASRAAPSGAFRIPLQGGGALSAASSSFQDNCCLVISSYSAPSLNATQLLLFPDPDTSRSMPLGYSWPYDGSEGTVTLPGASGGSGASGAGLSSTGAIAGLVLGLCTALLLAAALVWLLVWRGRRRRREAMMMQQSDGGSIYKQNGPWHGVGGGSGDPGGSSSSMNCGAEFAAGKHQQQQQQQQRLGSPAAYGRPTTSADLGAAAAVGQHDRHQRWDSYGSSGSGGIAPAAAGAASSEFTRSATALGGEGGTNGTATNSSSSGMLGNKRWQKLTTAISSKVQDIHQQRLRTALLQSQQSGSVAFGGMGGLAAAAVAAAGGAAAAAGGGNRSQYNDAAGGKGGSGGPFGSSSGTPRNQHGSGGPMPGAVFGSGSADHHQQQQQQAGGAAAADTGNALELKELIGRGTFGTVYRATWQGVNVAVKLLQLPPGSGRTMTESGLFGGSGGMGGGGNALLRAVGGGGWQASSGCSLKSENNLLKHEHMAVQEAAIGSCMMHPNIVSVYSISLRPAGLPGSMTAQQPAPGAAGNSGGLLLLREDGTAVVGADGVPGPQASLGATSLELLPWNMELVMEFCDQGTLREALDAALLVNKTTGQHDVPIVLSLAHNVACAMAYLHQEHIIHGDLKASNVLLKTCVPGAFSSSANTLPSATTPTHQQQQQTGAAAATGSQQPSRLGQPPQSSGAVAGPVTGSWSLDGVRGQQAAAAAADGPSIPQQQQQQQQQQPQQQGLSEPGAEPQQQQQQGPAASMAIMNAAAAVNSDEGISGMHSLLKCGWVVAKVSDFGLSMSVNPEETHVSSVHAGTLTHMAPEMLIHGHASKASDCYAFGILLWELATGGKAFAGIPKPLLGHCVVSQGMRPTWPPAMRQAVSSSGSGGGGGSSSAAPWAGLVALTERCWAQEPQARPSFGEIVQQLSRLLKKASASHGSLSIAAAAGPLSGLPSPSSPAAVGGAGGGVAGEQQQQQQPRSGWSSQPLQPAAADGDGASPGVDGDAAAPSAAGASRPWGLFSGLFGDSSQQASQSGNNNAAAGASSSGLSSGPVHHVVPMFNVSPTAARPTAVAGERAAAAAPEAAAAAPASASASVSEVTPVQQQQEQQQQQQQQRQP